jgi:NAD(P)-dependent dehydrogenase (short-subunit alcohol dehydrogenase family)
MKLDSGQHAFITGGANGIGHAIAQALAARGMRVTIADLDGAAMEAAVRANNRAIRAQKLDTRDRAGWAAAKPAAEAAFGPVDLLINNAGIGPNRTEFADMHPESWDRLIAINLTGIFNGVSAFAADMRARGTGHIVNTASMAGLSAGRASLGAYEAAKYGVVALSETLRAEMEPHGVGVSVLCPGYVQTNLGVTTARLGFDDRPEAEMAPGGMALADVAACVLDGIERNLLYILPDKERWQTVAPRHQAIREAFGQ